jgi:hypothetical protein
MTGLPTGRCASCEAALSYFARKCFRCGRSNQPNAVTALTALAALIVLGGAGFLGARTFLWPQPAPTAEQATKPATPETGIGDYGWLVQAMADCDVYAKRDTDVLYFLIIPIAPSGNIVPAFQPATLGEIGSAATLVRSTDALIGLRNGAFVIYSKPLTFALRDQNMSTVYKWEPAVGVAELKSRKITATWLTLGVQLEGGKDVEWGPTLNVGKGTCYWTNPLIKAGG